MVPAALARNFPTINLLHHSHEFISPYITVPKCSQFLVPHSKQTASFISAGVLQVLSSFLDRAALPLLGEAINDSTVFPGGGRGTAIEQDSEGASERANERVSLSLSSLSLSLPPSL
jgi:hypothetical protein